MLTMPFGKYKGVSFDAIPVDYLEWLLRKADGLTPGLLRTAIEAHLAGGTRPDAIVVTDKDVQTAARDVAVVEAEVLIRRLQAFVALAKGAPLTPEQASPVTVPRPG
jgi:hypothetical protein